MADEALDRWDDLAAVAKEHGGIPVFRAHPSNDTYLGCILRVRSNGEAVSLIFSDPDEERTYIFRQDDFKRGMARFVPVEG